MLKAQTNLYSKLTELINTLDITAISEDRKIALNAVIDYIQQCRSNDLAIRLNFICTHNSRRSHLSQVWAQTMAGYFNLKTIHCYSGGTEATAVYPMIIKTLKHQGFIITRLSENENPVYAIKYAPDDAPVIAFSKVMDSNFNPSTGFAAIMTCNSANEACPLVPGAKKRIALTYEDPKVSDGTPRQTQTYMERSLEIATEMFYIFSQINS